MKKGILLLTFVISCLLPSVAQNTDTKKGNSLTEEIARLESTLANIRNDLQEKKLQYSWMSTEKYIEYCQKLSKITNYNKEPLLEQLATTVRPQELEPLRLAYEDADKKMKQLLESYPEYVTLDSLYKRAETAEQKKDRKVALDGFYQRIYKEDAAYRPLLEKKRKAFKEHYIACTAYLLNECKSKREIVPNLYYSTTRNLLEASHPELRQLSIEVSTLENLQREIILKYQRLKYNIDKEE